MRALEIREVCERALRKIGAFAIRSSGARSEEIEEARYWFDMVVGHLVAQRRRWWSVKPDGFFSLVANTATYDITKSLTISQAPDGVQFVLAAYLYDPAAQRDLHEIPLYPRLEWEKIDNKASLGTPEIGYVTRDQNPTLTLTPVPNGVQALQIRIVWQSYSPDLVTGNANAIVQTLRPAYNLYLVTALSAQIGNGPVRKLPADEVKDMRQEAVVLLEDLSKYFDHEQANVPGQVVYQNF